jgi:hypothetical protein
LTGIGSWRFEAGALATKCARFGHEPQDRPIRRSMALIKRSALA